MVYVACVLLILVTNLSVIRSSAGKVVESSVGILGEYSQLMMDSVFSSVDQCPGLLRMALRQLWARVAERFTGAEHAVRNYFFFSVPFSKEHLSLFSPLSLLLLLSLFLTFYPSFCIPGIFFLSDKSIL